MPEWFLKHESLNLNIWSAASASGEEPYSIAMLCQEFSQKHKGMAWHIKASDISLEMLGKCREAIYSEEQLAKIDPAMITRYFDRVDKGLQIAPELKQNISFFRHNLMNPVPIMGQFDIVFIRNVLIYFDEQTKATVLANIHDVLSADGMMVLGESEALIGQNYPFKFIAPCFYQKI